MKTFNKIFLILGVAAAVGMSSCVKDLDMQPVDPNEVTDVSQNINQAFAGVYLAYSTSGANGGTPVAGFDGGMGSFQRAIYIGEEMPTDESAWVWDPERYGRINYGYVTPDLEIVTGMYFRLICNIALCNEFIKNVKDGYFTGEGSENAEEYARQARILRAGAYFYVLSFYENPPFALEDVPMGADPTQPGRAAVYDAMVSELENIVAYYKGNTTTTYYGFVGLDAAESLLAKYYLNGEVFAGRADYDKCLAHSEAVIGRLGHGGKYGNGLAPSYSCLFGANNQKYAIGGSAEVHEVIWTLPSSRYQNPDGTVVDNLTSWAGTTFLCAAWNKSNGTQVSLRVPTNDAAYKDKIGEDLLFTDEEGVRHMYQYYGDATAYAEAKAAYDKAKGDDAEAWKYVVNDYINNVPWAFDPTASYHISTEWMNYSENWGCLVTRKSFVNKFIWNDTNQSQSDDTRVAFWQTSAHGFTPENKSLVGDDWGNNGYLAWKWTNWMFDDNGNIDYELSAERAPKTGACGGDYAVIRLAEVYLMAAEAILQGGGGSQADAVKYVNYIRQRAYGDAYTPWSSVNMAALQDERCRELYQENTRRTDLIRWNLWCTGYTWDWKGGIKNGTNLPEYTKSYPFPTNVIATTSLKQQTGY